MRIARWIATTLLARRKPIRNVSRRGIVWTLDLREAIDLSIYLTGRFQHAVVREMAQIAGSSGTVIDVGANRGAIVLPLASLLPNHNFLAVEPVPDLVDTLRTALHANPTLASQVTVVRNFLTFGDQTVPSQVDASWNLFASSIRNKLSPASQLLLGDTQASSVDQLVQDFKISAVSAMKIDVEGFEPDVLRGAPETLRRFAPPILMEWQPPLQRLRGFEPVECARFLAEFGYKPHLVKRIGSPQPISWDSLIRQYADSYCEVVLKHKS